MIGAVVLLVLVIVPFTGGLTVPFVFDGALSSSRTQLILAAALLFACVAISYDVVFGYTGLLNAGHATVFAAALYATNIGMELGVPFVPAALIAVVLATALGAGIGALSLRARGLGFAMVTLAFCEAFSTLLVTDPFRVFGGEEGRPLAFEQVPSILLQARNVKWLYWLALATLVLVAVIALVATRSQCGRVWLAVRENEQRVEMLGLNPFAYKLVAYSFSSFLAAIAGTVYLIVVRAANPASASVEFSLAMIVMVVIGGRGRLWGAALGGFLYGILTLRLPSLSSSGALDGLPGWAGRVLAEPLFVLGVVFILIVLFAPGGVGGAVDAVRRRIRASGRSRSANGPGSPPASRQDAP
ncbi:branched-chain amino acid ABC transporter permease [Pseudonocardia ailaonensis]|uniref:Branched-chain amino acid ABC transporter permease n=1 Tax=Pseudonocardia ailaonensis TaxID=367279 RepID=A0ABN2N3I7_9PSEU